MIFEVDNTTQKLLSELQDAISGTIDSLKDEQSDIKETTEQVLTTLNDVATGQDLQNIKTFLNNANTKSTQQLTEILESLEIGESKMNELSKTSVSVEQYHELISLLDVLKVTIEKISHDTDEIEKGILNNISELMLKVSEIAEKMRSELKEDNKETLKALSKKHEVEQQEQKKYIEELMTRNELTDLLDKIIGQITNNYDVLINQYLISMKNTLTEIQNSQKTSSERISEFNTMTNNSLDDISKRIIEISIWAKQNNVHIQSLVSYLSLPGYKRFFKGLEVYEDETKI